MSTRGAYHFSTTSHCPTPPTRSNWADVPRPGTFHSRPRNVGFLRMKRPRYPDSRPWLGPARAPPSKRLRRSVFFDSNAQHAIANRPSAHGRCPATCWDDYGATARSPIRPGLSWLMPRRVLRKLGDATGHAHQGLCNPRASLSQTTVDASTLADRACPRFGRERKLGSGSRRLRFVRISRSLCPQTWTQPRPRPGVFGRPQSGLATLNRPPNQVRGRILNLLATGHFHLNQAPILYRQGQISY